jgi:hypothetical protein
LEEIEIDLARPLPRDDLDERPVFNGKIDRCLVAEWCGGSRFLSEADLILRVNSVQRHRSSERRLLSGGQSPENVAFFLASAAGRG